MYTNNKDAKSSGRPMKKIPKKKVCNFCVNKIGEIDYITLVKDIEKSGDRSFEKTGEKRVRYVTEKGKIIPRRMSGICVKHQRDLAIAIKRARFMALLPFKAE